jgi:photosystem II stability/assembly factor-like uncharacterized protein
MPTTLKNAGPWRKLVQVAVAVNFLLLVTLATAATKQEPAVWKPVGLSGGGGMFAPAISPADPDLMMLNCDMGAAYISEDGGRNWRMIHHAQLRSDTRCRPAFHPTDPDLIYASSRGELRVSRDRGHTFSAIGDLPQRLYGEIAIHPANPKLMLAGASDGHCWFSRDAGKSWDRCMGPTGQPIAFHFDRTRSPEVFFAATDRGIWRSEDGGQRWKSVVDGLPWTEIQGFAGGSNSRTQVIRLYCTIPSKLQNGRLLGGVYCSRDRGDSWQPAMGRGINRDTRKADQWAYGDIAQYKQVLTTDRQPETVYVCNTSTGFHPPHHETVFRSDDSGSSWRATFFEDPRFDEYNVAPYYVTASAGQSYKGGGAPFGAAICSMDPSRLITVRSHSQVTHDGGDSWFMADTYPATGPAPSPGSPWVCNGLVVTTTWHYYVDPFQPDQHYIAYTDLGFARSVNGGKDWIWWDPDSWAPWRNTCYEIAFDPDVPGRMWGAFSNVHDIPNDNIISERHGHDRPGGVCRSDDFGASWRPTSGGLPDKPVTSVVLDPRSPRGARTLYAGVFMDGVYKSTNDGRTWALKRNGLGHPLNRRVYRVQLHADGTLLAIICAKRSGRRQPLMSEGVGLYRSQDRGEHWECITTKAGFLYPKDFCVHPEDSNRILIGTCDPTWEDQRGGLYETRDGGSRWRRIGREGRQTFGGYYHPDRPGWIYMTLTEGAPGAGLWLSRDDGRSWQPFQDLPFSNIQRVVFDPANRQAIYVTTFGGSVWHGPVEP